MSRRPSWRTTSIVPHVVADSVIGEVACYLGRGLRNERALADKLAVRADAVFTASADFRKSMKRRGTQGRDLLYSFMRHWLGAELKRSDPKTFRRLPESFTWPGKELPRRCLTLKRRRRRRR